MKNNNSCTGSELGWELGSAGRYYSCLDLRMVEVGGAVWGEGAVGRGATMNSMGPLLAITRNKYNTAFILYGYAR